MRSAVLRSVRWWAGPLLLAAAALEFDAIKRRIPFGVWTTGPVDEVAHLSAAALGLLVLACFIDTPRRFYVAALIGSVAIDVDHIPLYLGLGDPAKRPVTHSLSTVAAFAAGAAASRGHRAVLAGAATGLVLHFARDIAEDSPGVRVFWPLQDTSWTVSYRWCFPGMIVVLTAARLVLVSVGLPRTRIPVFPVMPVAGVQASGGSGSSGPGQERAPHRVG
jgi:inner membrane protein